MTSWHGHRDDADIPAAVQQVWREKFQPGRNGRPGIQSNVDLAVLDSKGKLVHWFDGFAFQNSSRRESLEEYTEREINHAISRLSLKTLRPRQNPLILPDLNQSRGVRVFVRLMDDRMRAYKTPVVEVVPLNEHEWGKLAWSNEERSVDAADLLKWLSQVYPPGVMERTNPQTKFAYKIKAVTGTLSLIPAGADSTRRYAVLSGTVRFTDEGDDEFSYEGKLRVVLTYPRGKHEVASLRGVFEGIYPRYDRMRDRNTQIPLLAAFESLPE